MNTPVEIREIPLDSPYFRKKAAGFLESNGLTMPSSLQCMAALVNDDEKILATAAIENNIIKCVAVSPELQGENAAARVVSHIVNKALTEGADNLFVFTKPEYEGIFSSLGFKAIAHAADAVLLQSNPRALTSFTDKLKSERQVGINGAIVMHANPPTLGHKYLIDYARKECDHLYVILLEDNPSTFIPLKERAKILSDSLCHPEDVTILSGGDYSISAATFPDYFIKTVSQRTHAYAQIDAEIFARYIAPALGVTKRFLGTEPTDLLTSIYNEELLSVLPSHGIEVTIIERMCGDDSTPVSASSLRTYLGNGNIADALNLTTPEGIPALLASLACKALRSELNLTPKPGLVDKDNSGAHKDMDYSLMYGSINALHDGFTTIATLGFTDNLPSGKDLQKAGIKAEQLMNDATGGINTHRGAIFSLGLTIAAAAHLYKKYGDITPKKMSETISAITKDITPAARATSHGAKASTDYGTGNARSMALDGYRDIYNEWLPYLRSLRKTKPEYEAQAMTLLKIMTRIDDTNIYHRGGVKGAEYVRNKAADILNNFSMQQMTDFDKDLTKKNLSPGGSADMLALTLLNDYLIKNN